jgi:hypothetical protein
MFNSFVKLKIASNQTNASLVIFASLLDYMYNTIAMNFIVETIFFLTQICCHTIYINFGCCHTCFLSFAQHNMIIGSPLKDFMEPFFDFYHPTFLHNQCDNML